MLLKAQALRSEAALSLWLVNLQREANSLLGFLFEVSIVLVSWG